MSCKRETSGTPHRSETNNRQGGMNTVAYSAMFEHYIVWDHRFPRMFLVPSVSDAEPHAQVRQSNSYVGERIDSRHGL